MIVGEAPGRNEDEQGTPFVGHAGKILTRALEDVIGNLYSVDELFITNAVKCRPKGNATPRTSDINTCVSAYLTQEIAMVDAQYLLGLGNVAAQALLGVSGITRHRGRWYRLDSERERNVLLTYHPAYIGYQGLKSKAAVEFKEDITTWWEGVQSG